MKYLFKLGHQPTISTAEIKAVFSKLKLKYEIISTDHAYLILKTDERMDCKKLINILGGTIKIAKWVQNEESSLIEIIIKYLEQKIPDGKIIFSITGNNAQKKAITVKKTLKQKQRSVRYIKAKNSATVLYNKLIDTETDLTIHENEIYATCAIQNFNSFNERDYKRPAHDRVSGMLPPKLARILINLSKADTKDILLDPFCGSGTILMEAAAMGFKKIYGTDISQKAVDDTRRNLEWIMENENLKFEYSIKKIDAKKISEDFKANSIDTIVTEPFLGKALSGNESEEFLKKQAKELGKLYINAFKNFNSIVKPGTVIIFIIPRYKLSNKWIRIELEDEIKKIGIKSIPFDEKNKYLLYHRPNQYLGREIWKFIV
ncbi:MAG: methyltransferase domain-containing protein [Candidatus Magasanikbacteria bacterium]|nr:methyltransferase domain-containing protein [Candidatus Magasanikbacteria bacterium]